MSYPKVPIGELVSLRQGFAINKNTKHHISDEPTALPLLRIADMKDKVQHVFVKDTIPAHFIAKPEDIIYTRTGQVGLVFTDQYGVIHNNCFTVTPNDTETLNRYYLYYVLQGEDFYSAANNLASGAAQPDLPHGAFRSIEIPVPPVALQKRIAEILKGYDDLIENNQKQIKLLEEAAQRLYKEWFVDLRFPSHETTHITDGIPDGWTINEVADFGEIVTGKTPSTSKEEYYGGNIPFVKIPDMHNRVFPVTTEVCLTKEGADTQKNKYIPRNSLMVSCIATVGLVNIALEECQTNQQINSVILHNKRDLYFLYFTLKQMKDLLDGVGSNGATMTNVNKTKFGKIPVVCPTEELRNAFYEWCEPVFRKIESLSRNIILLQEARDSLLPKLMNGEIEV